MKYKAETYKQNLLVRLLITSMIFPYAAYWGWQRCFIGVLCTLFCLISFAFGKRVITIAKSPGFYGIAGLTAMSLVSLCFACDKSLAVLGTLQIVGSFLFYLLCLQWKRESGKLMEIQAAEVIVYCGFIIASLGIVLSFNKEIASEFLTNGRLASMITYPNTFAAFMLVCIIVSNSLKKKVWELILIQSVLWAALILSFSRTIYLLAGVSLAVMLFLNRGRRKQIAASAVFGCAMGAVLSGGDQFVDLPQRAASISPNATEWLERLFYYKDAVPMIWDHPFGIGAGNNYLFQGQYQTAYYYDVPLLHNGILQIAADFGIMAALFFLIALGFSFFRSRIFTNKKLALAVLFLHGLVDFDWQFVIMLNLIIIFIASEEDRFVDIELAGHRRQAVCAALAFVISVNIWAFLFDLYTKSGNYEAALRWNPYYTKALVAGSKEFGPEAALVLLEKAKAASGYRDETAYSESLKRNKTLGNYDAAWKDAERLMSLRPLKMEYVEEMAELSGLLANKSFGEGNADQAMWYCERITGIEAYLESANKRIDPLAYELKHKPDIRMTDRLAGLKQGALRMIQEIKRQEKEGAAIG